MLKINNTNFKKYGMPLMFSCLGISGMFLFSCLTFIPNQTFAESLIVDPNEHRSLSDISTMQEMSQQICINSREEETKQLTDFRDSKTYWVTKLKDGNCWMTQNLDFDLSTSKPLTPTDSDVTSNWTPDNSTRTGNINSGWSSTQTEVQSWDPGTYYYEYVTDWTNCGNSVAHMSSCTATMNNWSTTAPATEGEHYHVGNYYSWNAATAGAGGSITSGQATSSICPNGWRLPTSGNAAADFGKLMSVYGLRTSSGNEPNVNQVRLSPMYFFPSGYIGTTGLYHAGLYGHYSSSTPYSTKNSAYAFNFGSGTLDPSSHPDRHLGISVRCLVTGGWLDSYPELLDDDQANVSITVSPVISIDATSGMDEDVDFTKVATGNISASISSNQPYQVLLSTAQTTLEQSPVLENHNIPMITADQGVIAGTSSWGIKKKLSATTGVAGDITDASLYSPIGVNDDKSLFFKSASAESKTLNFAVGIAVSPELPSGKYSTQVTITAVAN